MKTQTTIMAWILAALASVTTMGSLAAERSLVSTKPRAFPVLAEWRMMNGDTIKFAGGEDAVEPIPQAYASGLYAGEGGRIELAGGKVIAYLDPLESIWGIVCSGNKKALLLEVFKRQPSDLLSPEYLGRFYYGYSSLLLVLPKKAAGNIVWTARRIMSGKKHIGILESINDEGRLALFRVFRSMQKEGAMKTESVWQTWDLDTEKMISEESGGKSSSVSGQKPKE